MKSRVLERMWWDAFLDAQDYGEQALGAIRRKNITAAVRDARYAVTLTHQIPRRHLRQFAVAARAARRG